DGWLATLPRTIAQVERAWNVAVGDPFQPGGHTAWVAPATSDDRDDLVVKVLWRHEEAEGGEGGLGVWAGAGAVRLHAAEEIDDATVVMLLERCRPGTTLEAIPEPEQDVVVSKLLPRLWREPPPGHAFPSLESMCDRWADEFEQSTTE